MQICINLSLRYSNKPTEGDELSDILQAREYAPHLTFDAYHAVNDGEFVKGLVEVSDVDEVSYKFVIKSDGSEAAQDVVVTRDLLQAIEGEAFKLQYVNGSIKETIDDTVTHNGTISGDKITWNLGDLNVGTVVTLEFKVKVPDVSVLTRWEEHFELEYVNDFEAGVKSSNVLAVEEYAHRPSITVTAEHAFYNSKTLKKDPLKVGSLNKIKYVITVTNTGTESAEKIHVRYPIPVDDGDVMIVLDEYNTGAVIEDGDHTAISWDIHDLDAGASKELTFMLKVPGVAGERTWSSEAYAYYDHVNGGMSDYYEKSNTLVLNRYPSSGSGSSFGSGPVHGGGSTGGPGGYGDVTVVPPKPDDDVTYPEYPDIGNKPSGYEQNEHLTQETPPTGDDSAVAVFALIAVLSLLTAAFAFIRLKKYGK